MLEMQSTETECQQRRWWHRLETTPKLFTLTFVLVAFSAKDATSEPLPPPSEVLVCAWLLITRQKAFSGLLQAFHEVSLCRIAAVLCLCNVHAPSRNITTAPTVGVQLL